MSTADAALDSADSLQHDAAWRRAFKEMEDMITHGLERGRDWQTLYSDPVVEERNDSLRNLRFFILMLRAMNDRTEDGRETVWKMLEEIRGVQKDENMWFAMCMIAYTSP